MVNNEAKETLKSFETLNESFERIIRLGCNMIGDEYAAYLKNEFTQHILKLNKDIREFGIDTSRYFEGRVYEKYTYTDLKLMILSYLLKQFQLKPDIAQTILNDFSDMRTEDFKDFAILCAVEPNVEQSMEELKRGLEEGLDINEIAVILGKNKESTHSNREIYIRYREFFRGRINSGHMNAVKQYLNAAKNGSNNYVASEMVLHADTLDDLKIDAPAVEMSWALYEQSMVLNKRYGNAYYIEVPSGPGEESLYKCFASDGNFQTYDEETAARWVCDRNSKRKDVRTRTVPVQTGIKNR